MTIRPLSRAEIRSVDRTAIDQYEVPGVVLMENAGRGAADILRREQPRRPIVICCGSGNNGGDGFVMARHLSNRGFDVHTLLLADPARLTGDALVNYRIVEHTPLPLVRCFGDDGIGRVTDELRSANWVVDALLGTGLQGNVRPPLREVITAINTAGRPVLAVDIPSGLDCDTGQPLGVAVRATLTVTFVARKLGFIQPGADAYLGRVHVVDIGVPRPVVAPFISE